MNLIKNEQTLSSKLAEHCFVVPFHQVDRAGVMFFAHLFTHAHDTYEQFADQLGFSLDRDWGTSDYRFPIVHAKADYRFPIQHGMLIKVLGTIIKIGNASFSTTYDFHESNCCHAVVTLVHCCIDGAGKVSLLPNDLRSKLIQNLGSQL